MASAEKKSTSSDSGFAYLQILAITAILATLSVLLLRITFSESKRIRKRICQTQLEWLIKGVPALTDQHPQFLKKTTLTTESGTLTITPTGTTPQTYTVSAKNTHAQIAPKEITLLPQE